MNLETLDFAKLKEMAKALNSATFKKGDEEVPFITGKKLKLIAVTKDVLAEAFDAAIQGMDEATQAELPEEIVDYYNTNFTDEGAETGTEPAPAADTTEKEKPEKEKKEKPAKEKKEKAELSCFGHKVGSQAAKLDDLLATSNPISLKDLSEKSGRSELGVKGHIKHLKDARGLTITEKDGMYTYVAAKK